jgi:hypothetical protein
MRAEVNVLLVITKYVLLGYEYILQKNYFRVDVLKGVIVDIAVFWDVTP